MMIASARTNDLPTLSPLIAEATPSVTGTAWMEGSPFKPQKMFMVDKTTPAYHRVTTAGFKLGLVSRYIWKEWNLLQVRYAADMVCVCGRTETLYSHQCYDLNELAVARTPVDRLIDLQVPMNRDDEVDLALMIENAGAVDEEHLRQDGYSEKEIKHIRRAYNKEQFCVAA